MKLFVQFIAALVLAAWYECRQRGSCWRNAVAMMKAVGKWNTRAPRHPHYEKRMETCRDCPVFYTKLQTCGTPLNRGDDFHDLNGRPMGCYCFMPLKANLPSRCWMRDITENPESGWPEELNEPRKAN